MATGPDRPIGRERLLELPDQRATKLEVGVADRVGRITPYQVLATDVQPAREADPAIDNEDLLVRAQVQERHVPGERGVYKAGSRYAAPPKPPICRREE